MHSVFTNSSRCHLFSKKKTNHLMIPTIHGYDEGEVSYSETFRRLHVEVRIEKVTIRWAKSFFQVKKYTKKQWKILHFGQAKLCVQDHSRKSGLSIQILESKLIVIIIPKYIYPETNSSHLKNGWLENNPFLLGIASWEVQTVKLQRVAGRCPKFQWVHPTLWNCRQEAHKASNSRFVESKTLTKTVLVWWKIVK